jgi:hypothetical protein
MTHRIIIAVLVALVTAFAFSPVAVGQEEKPTTSLMPDENGINTLDDLLSLPAPQGMSEIKKTEAQANKFIWVTADMQVDASMPGEPAQLIKIMGRTKLITEASNFLNWAKANRPTQDEIMRRSGTTMKGPRIYLVTEGKITLSAYQYEMRQMKSDIAENMKEIEKARQSQINSLGDAEYKSVFEQMPTVIREGDTHVTFLTKMRDQTEYDDTYLFIESTHLFIDGQSIIIWLMYDETTDSNLLKAVTNWTKHVCSEIANE